jgi:hypothetical protein
MNTKYFMTAMFAVATLFSMNALAQNPTEQNPTLRNAADRNIDSLLIAVGERDQAVRQGPIVDVFSLDKDGIDAQIEEINRIAEADKENQAMVFDILDNSGWPEGLSEEAVQTIFLVIDHADLEYQQKYFDLLREQAERGILPMDDLVTLQDRILMGEGKPQKHGTQTRMVGRDGKAVVYLWPVEDAENLDARRAEVGLPPIAEYLDIMTEYLGGEMEMIWDKTLTPADMETMHITIYL